MEYKNQGAVDDADDDDDEEEEEEIDNFPASATPVSYNPPSLRGSAFSKPILHPSASLISSPRGGGGGGGGGGASAAKNASLFGAAAQATSPLHPPPAPSLNSPDPAPFAGNSAPPSAFVRYRECLRNHAAASGGHVLDGCGEFMPESGRDFLKCAACGCHRSFHRKVDGGEGDDAESYFRGAAPRLPLLLPPPHPHASHHHSQKLPPPPLQFGSPITPSSGAAAFGSSSGGATTESSSEERMVKAGALTPVTAHRKRFRTKFTAEQKEKMQAFAERVGWRFQRQDEALVEQVCAEAGVRRQVLKVWMHNNKHLIKKQQQQQQQPPPPLPPPLRLEPEPQSQLHQHQPHSSQPQQQL